jgi:hypothetical protein
MNRTDSTHRRGKYTHKFLVEKPQRKKICRRHRHRWKNNIKMTAKKFCWIELIKDRVLWWNSMKTVQGSIDRQSVDHMNNY